MTPILFGANVGVTRSTSSSEAHFLGVLIGLAVAEVGRLRTLFGEAIGLAMSPFLPAAFLSIWQC